MYELLSVQKLMENYVKLESYVFPHSFYGTTVSEGYQRNPPCVCSSVSKLGLLNRKKI